MTERSFHENNQYNIYNQLMLRYLKKQKKQTEIHWGENPGKIQYISNVPVY